jgi:hypothetical protein
MQTGVIYGYPFPTSFLRRAPATNIAGSVTVTVLLTLSRVAPH